MALLQQSAKENLPQGQDIILCGLVRRPTRLWVNYREEGGEPQVFILSSEKPSKTFNNKKQWCSDRPPKTKRKFCPKYMLYICVVYIYIYMYIYYIYIYIYMYIVCIYYIYTCIYIYSIYIYIYVYIYIVYIYIYMYIYYIYMYI
jgi:hypothetical protein